MSDMFFYQERGKTVGPFSAEDIKSRIKDGKIRVFDLLYKDGEPQWRMALEHQSFRTEFKSSSLASLKERPWVVLQKKSGKSTEFITTGPFTQDEVRESIQAGKIAYSDYAWKDSLAEWKRIGSLEEFNPRARNAELGSVPPVPQETATDLLKNVVEFQRALPVNAHFEDIPPDAKLLEPQPPDDPEKTVLIGKHTFTQTKKIEPLPPVTNNTVTKNFSFTQDTVTQTVQGPPPVPTEKPVPKTSMKTIKPEPESGSTTKRRLIQSTQPPNPEMEAREEMPPPVNIRAARLREKPIETFTVDEVEPAKPRWLDWSLVGVLVLVLIAVVLIVSRFMLPKTPVTIPDAATSAANEPVPAPVVAPPPPPPIKPDPVVKPEPAAKFGPPPVPAQEPAPLPHEPSQLVLAVHATGSGQPQIELRTDGTSEYPVHLQIIGLPGQVTEGGGFYKFARLVPKGKLREGIEIPGLKLPQGKFIVRAETGELKKETKFSWGLNDPQYPKTMARQRKTWAYALWKERLNLFVLAQALERQITQSLVPSKKFQAQKWNALINLKRTDGGKYLMFEDWWELHNIAKDAKTGVSGALASRALKEREHLATFSVWK